MKRNWRDTLEYAIKMAFLKNNPPPLRCASGILFRWMPKRMFLTEFNLLQLGFHWFLINFWGKLIVFRFGF